jgi:hypothetical protein
MKRWKPELNEGYWFIREKTNRYCGIGYTEVAHDAYFAGQKLSANCFRTKKEAEQMRAKLLKVLRGGI